MSFSFDNTLAADLDRVRLEVGDTDSNGYFLHDETITALLTREGTVGGAVVASLKAIVALLSQPNFRADWLQIDNASARKSYADLLKLKEREYGIVSGALTGSATYTYRKDSNQTEEPTYSWAGDSEDDELV